MRQEVAHGERGRCGRIGEAEAGDEVGHRIVQRERAVGGEEEDAQRGERLRRRAEIEPAVRTHRLAAAAAESIRVDDAVRGRNAHRGRRDLRPLDERRDERGQRRRVRLRPRRAEL